MRSIQLALIALFIPCLCAGADVEPVGRLFSTPAERASLDHLRLTGEQDITHPKDQTVTTVRQIPEPAREQITLDGFVRRSSGKSTAWINQLPQNENEISHGVTVRQKLSRPPSISILLAPDTRLNLKPGQTFDKATGKVSEVYEPAPAIQAPVKIKSNTQD